MSVFNRIGMYDEEKVDNSKKINDGVRIYNCRAGHQWEGNTYFKGVGMNITLLSGEFLSTGSLCPYCLVDWLRSNFGSVTEKLPRS